GSYMPLGLLKHFGIRHAGGERFPIGNEQDDPLAIAILSAYRYLGRVGAQSRHLLGGQSQCLCMVGIAAVCGLNPCQPGLDIAPNILFRTVWNIRTEGEDHELREGDLRTVMWVPGVTPPEFDDRQPVGHAAPRRVYELGGERLEKGDPLVMPVIGHSRSTFPGHAP